jgi:hypothetical protein
LTSTKQTGTLYNCVRIYGTAFLECSVTIIPTKDNVAKEEESTDYIT